MSIRLTLRRIAAGAGALGAVAVATLLVASPAHAAGSSKVSVVHGIPGQPVDVYVNGKKTLDNFQPSKVAGPLDLPAGKYDIVIVKPGDPVTSPVVKVDQAAVPADANISLVAHLTADGKPTLTPFVNDTKTLAPGKARLVVRHTAAAPAVDVRAGGQPVFKNLTNPNEAKADRRRRSERPARRRSPPRHPPRPAAVCRSSPVRRRPRSPRCHRPGCASGSSA
ncbi:DUF4397 domain-containing protein [Dactylosporangium sp. CA-152071]|uniref:DUF4397 domain-containing protein n=1 Tax=Dactylosporangium sp. CA-152071 TaxID=3239933 RepID=UPI003D8B3EE8